LQKSDGQKETVGQGRNELPVELTIKRGDLSDSGTKRKRGTNKENQQQQGGSLESREIENRGGDSGI